MSQTLRVTNEVPNASTGRVIQEAINQVANNGGGVVEVPALLPNWKANPQAAMLDVRILIRTRCHHCGEPLELAADSTGPLGASEVMVWVGKRDAGERRAWTSF